MGLDESQMILGVMDGLLWLEKILRDDFTKAKVQRYQLHAARNVLTEVPKKLKKTLADDMRSTFYVSSESKSMEFLAIFKDTCQRDPPSTVKCLENSLEAFLTFLLLRRKSGFL